jgi:FkbM family methyltransferase
MRVGLAAGHVAKLVPRGLALSIYRYPRLAAAVRAFFNRTVPPGPTEVRVAAGPLKATRLVLDLGYEKFLWLGTYEPWVQDVILQHLTKGGVAWDVGAFIGYHTLLMARVVGAAGRVVALEPDPRNRQRLQHHLKLNEVSGVVVVPFAAGAEAGPRHLERVERHAAWSHFSSSGEIECEVVRLDDLAKTLPPPTFVKVDVEGAEAEVIEGAQTLIRRIRPTWVVEIHGDGGESGLFRLREAGYRLRHIGKGLDAHLDLPVGGPAHVLAVP